MDPFEQMFRYAWQMDFGESPEQTLSSMAPAVSSCNLSTSHFQMDASTMLKSFRNVVIEEAKRNEVDGVAVAGAIAWEYERNWKGRVSDNWQVYTSYRNSGGSGGHGAGMGWGSIHGSEAKKLRPNRSDAALLCQRMEAKPAIALVAEFMNNMAALYFELSDGIWVRDQPAVLAAFFNAGRKIVEPSAEKRRTDPGRATGVVKLNIGPNPMAAWVHQNGARFAAFKTNPQPPQGVIRAIATT